MKIYEKNIGLSRYYTVEVETKVLEEYELNMLKYNLFNFILKPEVCRQDDTVILMYKTDGLHVVKGMLNKEGTDKADIYELFNNIMKALSEAESFLLNTSNVFMDLDYILYDTYAGKYIFMYIPGININFQIQMKKLIEQIIENHNHKKKDDVLIIYDLYARVIEDNFSPAILLDYLNEMRYVFDEKNSIPEERKDDAYDWTEKTADECKTENDFNRYTGGKRRKKLLYVIMIGLVAVFISAVVYINLKAGALKIIVGIIVFASLITFAVITEDNEEKEIDEDMKNYRRENEFEIVKKENEAAQDMERVKEVTKLVPAVSNRNRVIILKNGSVLVGRIKNNADYYISNEGISRIHANIIKNGNTVTVTDMNSTNGTYVNNMRIYNGNSVKLKYGDTVRFADEEYYCL